MNRHIIPIVVLAVVMAGGAYFLFGRSEAPPVVATAEKEEHEEEHNQLKLTSEQIEKAAIKVETAGPASIRETLSMYGVITPNAERTRDVAARFPGTIRSLAKILGDTVRQGESLATVESNESLQAYAITAPIGGVVTARNANPGEQTGDKVLFTVSDLSSVWTELSVFPRDAAKVQVGQTVLIRSADTGLKAEGKVIYIAPVGSAANQTRVARVLIDNTAGHWAPGLYVTAEVVLSVVDAPLAIHAEAIQTLEGKESIFVRNEAGFETRELKLGHRDSEHAEVLEGVRPGENYASTNSFILKAERGKGEAEHDE